MRLCVALVAIGSPITLPIDVARAQPPDAPSDFQSLRDRIDAAIRPAAKLDCRVGARVLRVPHGQVVYSLHADELFKPASNMKLVSTAAGIAILGRDFKFRTILALCGPDLVVIGDGDPGFGDPRLLADGDIITSVFHRWAAALKDMDIDEITGDLVIDDSIFDRTFVHPNWDEKQMQGWYQAPVGGLCFNDNCMDALVHPVAGGNVVAYETSPRLSNVEVINKMSVGDGRPAAILRTGPGMRFELRGRIKAKTNLGPVTVDDPGLFFADACRTALAAKGVRIAGTVRRQILRTPQTPLPRDCQLLAVHETPLADVIRRANKNSQNLFAECLLKRVGYAYAVRAGLPAPVGSYETGQAAIKAFLKKFDPRAEQLVAEQFVIDDGSGLSHENRLSPKVITNLLLAMYAAEPVRDMYVNSLAVSGKEGTLKKRMKDIAGKVHAKTGFIRGVRSLSGYVEGAGGQWYCFSILFDSVRGAMAPMNTCHRNVCRVLATWTPE